MTGFRYYSAAALYFATVGVLGIYIPWVLLDLTGTAVSVGIMLCVRAVPGLLLSGKAGGAADRLDKRKLIAMACAIKSSALVLFLLFKQELWNVGGFYALIALISVANTFFLASIRSYLHVTIDKDHLVAANGRFESSTQVGTIAGAGVGGLITAFASIEWAFALVIAMLVYVAVQSLLLNPETVKAAAEKAQSKVMETKYSVLSDKALWPGLMVLLVPMLYVQMDNILLAPLSKVQMGLDASGFGFLNAAYSVGAMTIGLVLAKTAFKQHQKWLFCVAIMVAAAHLLLSVSDNFVVGMVACILVGVSVIWCRINANSVIMQQVDKAYAGKLQALLLRLHYGSIFIVGLVFGWLADMVGYDRVYQYISVSLMLLLLPLAVSAIRAKPAVDVTTAGESS
ncbi:MAG: MFS transporter [Reinekea sp.]